MNITEQKLVDSTLALAGILQAAILVRDLAKTGMADEAAVQVSINSIYKIDSKNVVEIYGGAQGVQVGLRELVFLLGGSKANADPYISRYAISLMHLERRLRKNPEMQGILQRRIKQAILQANYFSAMHPTVLASLADTYLNTLGRLSFRIHLLGQAKFLQQPEIVNKIRALLLAGVRSAVLWRQVGGSRWQLFLQRGKLTQMAKQILQSRAI
jgi:high frequency lysogenization protein